MQNLEDYKIDMFCHKIGLMAAFIGLVVSCIVSSGVAAAIMAIFMIQLGAQI